jgi:methionyl-tRNA synthetase
MCGDDVHYVCGADEHGVAITLKAEQSGQPYEAYVDDWQEKIAGLLADVGIEFDIFSGTAHHRNPFHRPLSQEFFTDLLANGYLLEKSEEQFYSESTQRFLPDRYVEGTCYKCGFESARGDECPNCGSWLEAKRLVEPRSTLDGEPPVLKTSVHWYLDLGKIRDEWLAEWFESKIGSWKGNVARFVKAALKDLHDRPITRDLPWGVPVPLPEAEGKVLYVWFEAPIGYLSISQQYFAARGDADGFLRLWQSPDTELLHFIGKDNITFHVLVFPAMLYGTQRKWVLPANVPANEFFNLEGRKFNTSAGWYIPEESVKGRYPVDALRYALTTMMPETADSDWSWREFQARLNDDLADNLGNFVARTLRFAERFLDGVVPPPGELTDADKDILEEGRRAAEDMKSLILGFGFRKAAQRLMAYCSSCNKYYDQRQPWKVKQDRDRAGHIIRICAELVRSIGVLCYPIMPETSRTVLEALGKPPKPRLEEAGGIGLGDSNLNISPLPVLFPKVEDKVIEAELAKLKTMDEPTQDSPVPTPDLGAKIDYDQFSSVDLRAGTVIEAEKHPNADRLLVLKVDLGFESRTVVAGIAASYEPGELGGRRVVVVANLAPRKLRGVESNGMILAGEDSEGKPRLIDVDPGTPNGTRVV